MNPIEGIPNAYYLTPEEVEQMNDDILAKNHLENRTRLKNGGMIFDFKPEDRGDCIELPEFRKNVKRLRFTIGNPVKLEYIE